MHMSNESFGRKQSRLSQRLDDLRDRLEELTGILPRDPLGERYDSCFYAAFTAEDTDYVVPEQLSTIQDVLTAIRRTEAKLWDVQCEERLAKSVPSANVISGQIVFAGFNSELVPEQMKCAS